MLQIKAKDNSTVEVVKGSFPLGLRNTIKVDIDDNSIRQFIKPYYTGHPTDDKYNLIPYGNFDEVSDIDNLKLELTTDSICEIESDGVNYSNCLHFKTTNKDGLGVCQLVPNKNLVANTKYVLSFYAKADKGELFYLDFQGNMITISGEDKWQYFRFEFSTPEELGEDNNISILLSGIGEGWLDTFKLFKASNEEITNEYNNIHVEVKVLNPPNYNIICEPINKIARLVVNNDNISVILYMPSITVVDFRDNLLCKLLITVSNPYRVQVLGDSSYHDITTSVYESDPFILEGFILSEGYNTGDDTDPGDDDCDGCNCELEVEEI